MTKIIIILFAFVLFPLSLHSAQLNFNTNRFCNDYDPDFMDYYQNFPKCRRNVPRWLKTQIYREYGIPDCDRHLYTIDHCIALSVGGSNHHDNLGPQLRSKSTAKLEYQLYLKVRNRQMDYREAIDILLDVKNNCTY